MKTPQASNNSERGANERIYFDSDAKRLLADMVVATTLPKSNVVCALVRIASGAQPKPGEERVAALLKRAIGRESMVNFLRAVGDVVGADARAITCHKGDGVCESWILPEGVGVLAFFQPTEANVGDIFTKAAQLMGDYAVARVIVATTNGETLANALRDRLAAAGIELVSLADLRSALAKLTRKPRQGKGGAGR